MGRRWSGGRRRPRVVAAALTLGLLGVSELPRAAEGAVQLKSSCPVVGLGALTVGDTVTDPAGAPGLTTTLSQPVGLAIDQNDGTMYVSERNWDTNTYLTTGRGRLRRITQAGVVTDLPLGPPETRLGRLAINPAGTIVYVATKDRSNVSRVYAVDVTAETPTWTVIAGGGTDNLGNGIPATDARFFSIGDLGFSPTTGLLYIAGVATDQGAVPPVNVGIVREVDGAGNIRTVAGGVISTAASRLESIPANTAYVQFDPVTLDFDDSGVMNLGTLRRVRRIPPEPTPNPYGDGIITTFAGANGTEDITGDGGAAGAARLGEVNGVTLDSAGNLYVGGIENHALRRITGAGAVSTIVNETGSAATDAGIAGFVDGTGTESRLAFTQEIEEYNGSVFVADSRNNRIRRIVPGASAATTTVSTVAGRGPNLVDESGPAMTRRTGLIDGMSVAASGNVYFADRTAYRVWRRSPDGLLTAIAGNGAYRGGAGVLVAGPATDAALGVVRDVAVSPDDQTLYIMERTRILVVDLSTGTLSLLAGTGAIGESDNVSGPAATLDSGAVGTLALEGGFLYASGTSENVRRISTTTGAVDTPITLPSGPAPDISFVSLEGDGSGGLFLASTGHVVYHWPGSGAPAAIAGTGVFGRTGDGGPAAAAQVGAPRGLTLLDRPGADAVLYVASGVSQIRSITATSDPGADRWRNGTIRAVAGSADAKPLAPGYWGDGLDLTSNSAAVRFNFVRDMDIDGQERLFVADSNFEANPGSDDATNTGPHMIRVLTDTGCSEATLGAPGSVGTATSQGVALAGLPLAQIPFDSAAIAATPMRSVPMRSSELETTPMRSSPMRSVPMRSVPMRSVGVKNTPMRSSSLSSFPLDPNEFPGGWPERLAGTPFEGRLPQHIAFADLLDNPETDDVDETSVALTRSPEITLVDIDMSASPMRSVSIASLALGSTPMRSVPMRSSLVEATDEERFDAWCEMLEDISIPEISSLGYTCESLGLTPESPLLALDLASVPMRSVPMRSVPMRSVDISASPMRSVPMRSSGIAISGLTLEPDVRVSPMRSVPMRSVVLASLPMRSVPLSAIPMRSVDARPSPMRSVLLSDLGANLNLVVNTAGCSPLCVTLGDAANQNKILPTANLGHLLPALEAEALAGNERPLGDLRYGTAPLAGLDKDGDNQLTEADEVNLGDVIPFLPEEPFISLADVLVGFLAAQDLPWEDVDLEAMGITSQSGAGATATLPVSFRLYPGQDTTIPITVDLPTGWRYASSGSLNVTPDAGGPTSAPALVPSISLDAETSVQSLSYVVPAGLASPSTISFDIDAFTGNRLGSFEAEATIGPVVDGGASRTFSSTPVTVTDPNEAANNTYDDASIIQPDTLYLGHLNAVDDTDYYRVSASGAGAVTRINLSHLDVDTDLVVYEEDPSQFNFRENVAKLRQQSGPVEMSDPSVRRVGEPREPQELQDIVVEPGKVVADISANRGTANESVELINDKPGVEYVIAVRGYNKAFSADPYVVRVQQYTPPGAVACDQSEISLPSLPDDYEVTDPIASLPVGTQTLILANRERLTRSYGETQAEDLISRLETFGSLPTVNGQVVLVDGDGEVRSAYTNWDLDPCGLGLPNLVVRKINDHVDALLGPAGSALRDSVENLVVIGSDEQIPMARLIDNTKLSNELEYGAELLKPPATPGGEPISTPQTVAMASKSLLTDDPYASLSPKLFGRDVVYPPDLTIGRLVESPAEVLGVIEQFTDSDGQLDPDSALTTGYDFLTDGAQGVHDGLARSVPAETARDDELINDAWGATDLAGKLTEPADPADIASLNAHFDHHRLLPAAGDNDPAAALFTTDDVFDVPNKLNGRLLFSMGCHSGTGAPDFYLGGSGGDALDWPQVFAQQRAIWVANSGFGYGDTATIAYSERLMAMFAEQLGGGTTAGESLRLAKQEYLGSGIANSYDAKALTQIIYYGLPMFRVGSGPAPQEKPFVETSPDPMAGNVPSHSLTVSAPVDRLPLSDPAEEDGSRFVYYDDLSESVPALQRKTQVVDGRPIQPRVDVDVTAERLEARGAVLTGLTMRIDPLKVAVARPVVDSAATERPIPASEMVYPSTFQNVTNFEDESGPRSNLVLIPGQWLPDDDPSTPANQGFQRRFTSMTSTVYYAEPGETDDVQPIIASTSGSASGGGVTFRAAITDRTPTGVGTVTRVSVLYLDDNGGDPLWRSTELTPSGPGEFIGGGAASGTEVDYLVQAVDAAGNVSVSSNKARMFTSGAAPVGGPGENGAPVVSGPEMATGVAFEPAVFTGDFADGDESTSWTGTVNNGAGDTRPIVITGSGFVATLPAYSASGSYVATVSICDDSGACGVDTVPVMVAGSGVIPTTECTVLSFGQAITWWGTSSTRPSPVTFGLGTANRFSPAPNGRGQPTVVDPGPAPERFATQTPTHQRLSWLLGGGSVSAMSARGCAR